jgi:phage replication O-like protein O
MVSPQYDLIVSRRLFDELIKTRLAGELMQCLLFVISKTNGIGRFSNKISLSQFSAATNLSKPHVCRALKKLSEMAMLTIAKDGKEKVGEYAINLDYSSWKPIQRKINGKYPLPEMVTEGAQRLYDPSNEDIADEGDLSKWE